MMSFVKSLFLVLTASYTLGQLLVTLPNGQIRGHELKTFTNKSYYAYQAIPYATPPLEKLRFQAPQPAQNWSGVINATKDSSMCYQLTSDSPEESEDCLYINVYTPILDRNKNNTKLPVVFWIYGGGLRNGAATFQEYRPDYWMDEDLIIVTHNYRVGIFGFLSTGDSVIPDEAKTLLDTCQFLQNFVQRVHYCQEVNGNNGLKDQVLALKWTFENIHIFGGDKNKITVHGQSAGAVSASYHLLIKQSAGLFQSVIAESGSPMNIYSFIENPKEYALQLTRAINPNISSNASNEEIRDFLLSLDGKTIDSFSRAPAITQPAVAIEPDNPSAVVTKEMYEMFDSGDFFKVPILMGFNSEECLFIAKSNDYLVNLGGTYDKNASLVLPAIFPHDPNVDKNTIGEAIKQIYVNQSDTWANHPGRVVRHYSDQRFSRAIIKQGKLISKYAPVYFYQFSYDGDVGGWSTVVEDAERIQHAEELYYVFLNRSLSEISESDALTHNRLIKLWTNFVKYKNPTPKPIDLLQNIIWPEVTPTSYQFLNINNTLNIGVNPKVDFFSKWENVYETYGKRPFSTY